MGRDPYQVLGVAAAASEAEIRARYLECVRQYPPEQAPERFAEVRAAYEQLRDPVAALQRRLFALEPSCSIEDLVRDAQRLSRQRRLKTDVLLSLVR